MNGFPETYSVDPESTGQRPHDQIDNLIDEHEGSSLFNLLSFLTELAPGYSPLERMGEKETFLQKAGEVPTFLMGLGLLASPQGVRKTATKLGSRRVLKEFGEEVADPLYHNTPLDAILDVLKEGSLKGPSSISFTRNPNLDQFGPAQIMVSKDKIKSLGRMRPIQYMKEGHKYEAEERFFIPQQRHKAIKGEARHQLHLPKVQRTRPPVKEAKIPTEKFEGIRIDKFMGETQWWGVGTDLFGREYDKATIEYITELMREAHKRKVPIILGPEATETFYKLGMDKKLPKPWQGRLVIDSEISSSPKINEAAKEALKTAKESGEKMVTLYRGNQKWVQKEMVINKSFVGPETVSAGGPKLSVAHKTAPSKSLFVTTDPVYAAGRTGGFFSINQQNILKFMKKEKAYYGKHDIMIYPNNPHWNKKDFNKAIKEQTEQIASIKSQAKAENIEGQHVLEFQVPQSWIEKYGRKPSEIGGAYEGSLLFDEGLPVTFLKDVHRN